MAMRPSKPVTPHLGIALGSGGMRGLAHIGILKVLEEEGVPVRALAGTSIGALIAAAWAAGLRGAELEAEARQVASLPRLARLYDPGPPLVSLVSGGRLGSFLDKYLGDLRFEDLQMPMAIVATDLDTGERVVLREGRLVDAVRASSAVPGIFAPVRVDGRRLVDGALVDPVPTGALNEMGVGVVVAVDVGPVPKPDLQVRRRGLRPGIVEALMRSGIILMHQLTKDRLAQAPPALLLRPEMDEAVLMLGGRHAQEAIAAGELVARAALPALRQLMAPQA